MSNIGTRLRESIRFRGVGGTMLFVAALPGKLLCERTSLQHHVKAFRDRRYDRRHGVDTGGRVWLNELEIDNPNREFGERYEATDTGVFHRMLNCLSIDYEDFVFIDFGSGKGRALLLASEYPFKEIIGVEFAEQLHLVARRNITSYKSKTQRCWAVTSVCADATTFAIPEDNVVVYMANPFGEQIMAKVLENIRRLAERRRNDMIILYAYPQCRRLLDDAGFLTTLIDKGWFAVYRCDGQRDSIATDRRGTEG